MRGKFLMKLVKEPCWFGKLMGITSWDVKWNVVSCEISEPCIKQKRGIEAYIGKPLQDEGWVMLRVLFTVCLYVYIYTLCVYFTSHPTLNTTTFGIFFNNPKVFCCAPSFAKSKKPKSSAQQSQPCSCDEVEVTEVGLMLAHKTTVETHKHTCTHIYLVYIHTFFSL